MQNLLEYPCVVGRHFLIVVFLHPNFLETVPFIESFRVLIRCLHMKINPVNFWPGFRSSEDQFKAFRTQAS